MQICKATPQKGDFYGRSHLRRICPCHSVMLQWFLYKSLYILKFQTATNPSLADYCAEMLRQPKILLSVDSLQYCVA